MVTSCLAPTLSGRRMRKYGSTLRLIPTLPELVRGALAPIGEAPVGFDGPVATTFREEIE